ncbi:MAG: Uma2 family endonuclease [Candidatus Competibacteraceae bacterium]
MLVPDLAGWRRERMPRLPHDHRIEVVPDWVCEILSPSTAKTDRVIKMPVYARHGVPYLWLVDRWRILWKCSPCAKNAGR